MFEFGLKNNLFLRFVSSLFMITVSIISLQNTSYLMLLVHLIYLVMFLEWIYLCLEAEHKDKLVFLFIGSIFIIISFFSARYILQYYMELFLQIVFLIVITDTFAMLGGKLFKGYKFAPKISPNKTWSGFVSAIIACFIIYNICMLSEICFFDYVHRHFNRYSYNNLLLSFFAISVSIISQISDLSVSFFKRKYKVKDSSNLIPGHGGFLDRFDAWILTFPLIFSFITCKL